MAIDDDPLQIMARQIAEDRSSTALTIGQSVATTVATAMLPKHIGELITGLLGVVSQERWNQRVSDLLKEFAQRISALSAQIEEPQYYQSEEFQALLLEAIDQQRTERDASKRARLAAALARSGTNEFLPMQDKEVLIKTLRTLSAEEVGFLASSEKTIISPCDEEANMASRIEALGLFDSWYSLPDNISRHIDADRDEGRDWALSLIDAIGNQRKNYAVSLFGTRFLKFLSCDKD